MSRSLAAANPFWGNAGNQAIGVNGGNTLVTIRDNQRPDSIPECFRRLKIGEKVRLCPSGGKLPRKYAAPEPRNN